MKLFFGEIIPDVKINDEEQQHIVKVLRMKEGEEIFVTDGKGNLAKGNLVFEGKKVSLNVTEVQEYFPKSYQTIAYCDCTYQKHRQN
jgi:16S rRNA (uracil1498-N3)-methyltransferase